MKYLLPCQCGQSIPVEVRQAGETVACPACGASQEVPTMRGLAGLQRVEESTPAAATSGWGPRQGVMLLGLLVALGSLAAIVYLQSSRPTLVDEETVMREMGKLPVENVWQVWQAYQEHGINLPQSPEEEAMYAEDAELVRWTWVASAVGLAGLISAAIAFFNKPSPAAGRRTPGRT